MTLFYILIYFLGAIITWFCSYTFYVKEYKRKKTALKLKRLWIARDKDDMLYLYEDKPELAYSDAHYFDVDNGECFNLPMCLFPEVTFENSPQQVELKLIK